MSVAMALRLSSLHMVSMEQAITDESETLPYAKASNACSWGRKASL